MTDGPDPQKPASDIENFDIDQSAIDIQGRRLTIGQRMRFVASPISALTALVALAMSCFLRFTTADALLPALISTQRLTFFYWGQDRLANLVPALATPIENELANFYAQSAVMGISFFVLIMMFVWFHLRISSRACSPLKVSLVTTTSGLLIMGLMVGTTGYTLILEQQYALSASLFLVGTRGMMTDSNPARFGGAVSVIAAALVNPSTVLMTPVAWLLRVDDQHVKRRMFESIVLGIGALGVTTVASRYLYDGASQASLYSDFSIDRMIDGVPKAFDRIVGSLRVTRTALALSLASAVLVARWNSLSGRLRVAYVAVPTFGLVWTVVFSGNLWVGMNLHGFRYFFPLYGAIFFLITGAITELATVAEARVVARDAATNRHARFSVSRVLSLSLIAVAALGIFRLTSRIAVPILDNSRPDVAATQQYDVQIVVGNYWRVWPIVFLGRNEGHDLYGLTYRSDPVIRDVIRLVNGADAAGSITNLLCVDIDVDTCVGDFSRYTGQHWTLSKVESDAPLVITVDRPSP